MFFIKIIVIILFFWNLIIFFIKQKKYKKNFPKKIKNINLGSSHAYYAFNYENKENSLNLAELSQTLYYDEIMLDYLWNRIEKNTLCFIVLSYFSFASKERWVKEDLIKYYKILPIKYFKKKEKIECIIFRYFPLIWSIKKKINKKNKNRKIASVIGRIKGHVCYLEGEKNKEFNLAILKRIIERCKKKNMNIIILTTPFTSYYNSFFSEELLKEKFYKNIYKLKEEYKIDYIDFSHKYENFEKKEYFDDFDHLNEKGSEIFMRELNYVLKERNIILK